MSPYPSTVLFQHHPGGQQALKAAGLLTLLRLSAALCKILQDQADAMLFVVTPLNIGMPYNT